MKHFARFLAVALVAAVTVACLGSCGSVFKSETINIGATGPLSGAYASYGTSVKNGAELAVEEINKKGGLQFSFDMKDDEGDGEKAQNGFNSLYEAGMQVSIGAVTSGACEAFAASAVEKKTFVLTPSASDAKVITKGDNIFRVCFGDPQQGTIAADELAKKYGKIGVIYDSGIDYSKGIYQAFEAEMTQKGKTKGTDYFVYPCTEDTMDFSTHINGLKSAGCEVIFLPIYYQAAGLVAKAAAAAGFNVPIYGADGLDGIKDQIDSSVTASISYITPFDVNSTDAKVSAFVAAYREKYGTDPDQFAADGYDAIMIIYEAITAAGVTDTTISAADLSDKLTAMLTSASFSYTGLTGTDMRWTKEGSCEKAPMVVEVSR